MIPARLGSKRVPKKNLRFLGGKPLLAWVTETSRDSGLFDAVIVNTESDEIATLAERLGVGVYRRDPKLAEDGATSSDFVMDFLEHDACDELYQVTPTSPFLEPKHLSRAVKLITSGCIGTVVSLKRIQAECLNFNDEPINFDPIRPMLPSQHLMPVFAFCNGVFGWTRESFLADGCYGKSTRVGHIRMEGASALDIDTEEDFAVAEATLAAMRAPSTPRYWSPTYYSESDAALVTKNDGIAEPFTHDLNLNVFDYSMSQALPRAVRVVEMTGVSATLITQMPGEGNREHYHPDVDEWWLILGGEYRYEIGGHVKTARRGDVVQMPRGCRHRIVAEGRYPATRLAVSRDGVEHVYHD